MYEILGSRSIAVGNTVLASRLARPALMVLVSADTHGGENRFVEFRATCTSVDRILDRNSLSRLDSVE